MEAIGDTVGWRLGDDQSTMLGIEILLPEPEPSVGLPGHRGRIWLEGASGLHLLYGKNGSGKSTVLRALADLFEGRKSKAQVSCFVRLEDVSRGGNFDLSKAKEVDTGWILVPDWSLFVQDAAHSLQSQERELDLFGGRGERIFSAVGLQWDSEMAKRVLDCDLSKRLTPLEVRPWEEVARYFLALQVAHDATIGASESYARQMVHHGDEGAGGYLTGAIGEIATSGILRLSPTGVDHPAWTVELAAALSEDTPCLHRLRTEIKESVREHLCALYPEAANSDADLQRACALFMFSGSAGRETMATLLPSTMLGTRGVIKELFGLLPNPEHSLIACDNSTNWWSLECKRPLPGWPTLLDLDNPSDPNSWVKSSFISLLRGEASPSWHDRTRTHRPLLDDATRRVLDGFAGQGERRYTTGRNLETDGTWTEGDEIRAEVLRKIEGPEATSISEEAEEASRGSFIMWGGSSASRLSATAELPELEILVGQVSQFGNLLPQLGIGLGGLRLKPNWDLASWLDGMPGRLEALDEPSGEWVELDQLSEAQQRWVANALTIGHARDSANALVLIADEADVGVHVTASMSIFRTLSELPGIGFTSSHSPAALRTPLARLLHVHRNVEGNIAVGPAGFASDVEALARELGVGITDVLASNYLAVVVEGLHDEIVLKKIFEEEHHLGRMIIVPGRGTHTMKGIPDATLLVEFTDQPILIIVDNARNERLQPVVEALKLFQADHRSMKDALRESGFEDLRSGATPEERTVLEIIERSYSRRVLDRIDIYGLPTRDVIQLLPAQLFGLEADWPQLEKDYKSDRTRRDFWTWLSQEHGVDKGKKTLRKALSNLDSYTPGLSALRNAVETALTRATLERGLSS